MSAFGGKADIERGIASCPLLSQSGHRQISIRYRDLWNLRQSLRHWAVQIAARLSQRRLRDPFEIASRLPGKQQALFPGLMST